MKRSLLPTTLAVLLLTVLCFTKVPAASAQDEDHCSNASVAGKWGYTYVGSLILPTGPLPVAAVGRFTMDKEGNLSGTQSRSNGGSFSVETITGTLTVNSDCSATGNFNVYQSGQLVRSAVLSFVLVDNAKEFRGIFDSLTLANGPSLPVVITLNARKIFFEK